jgi:hypothetical protein
MDRSTKRRKGDPEIVPRDLSVSLEAAEESSYSSAHQEEDTESSAHPEEEDTDSSVLPEGEDPSANEDRDSADSSDDEYSVRPDETAPEHVQEFMETRDEAIEQLMQDIKRFHVKVISKKIRQLKNEIRDCKDDSRRRRSLRAHLSDMEWFLVNRRRVALQEVCLSDEWNVHSLQCKKGKWYVLAWVSAVKQKKIPVEQAFVRKLVGPINFSKPRFRTGKMVPLRRYERMIEVRQTHFQYVGMTKKNTLELVDGEGWVVEINEAFARQILRDHLVDKCCKFFHDGIDNKRIKISSGSCGISTAGTEDCHAAQKDTPRIQYWNGNEDPADVGDHCLAYSLASALHHLGYVKEAERISLEDPTEIGKLFPVLCTIFREVSSKKISLRKVWFSGEHFNPLLEGHVCRNPVLACLKALSTVPSTFGKKVLLNHCVCFLGGYVFDCNQKHALEINKKNLDEICSNVVSGAVYNGLYWSRELLIW